MAFPQLIHNSSGILSSPRLHKHPSQTSSPPSSPPLSLSPSLNAGMSSSAKSSSKRKARTSRTRRGSAPTSKSSRRSGHGRRILRTTRSSPSEVTEKLESLRSLIPAGRSSGEEEVTAPATDELFQETADYILRLRAQVVVLQRLIQLYGSDSSQTDATVSSAVL